MARKRKKIYYPTGQIQKGLYTNGGEWMLEDGTEYIGDYHKYITGEIFTLGTYSRTLSKKLIPYINLNIDAERKKFEYDALLDEIPKDFVFAKYDKPSPTEKDYTVGFFNRYFVRRYSNQIITEVNKDTFNNVQSEHYSKIKLAWKLTGDVTDVNRKQVLSGSEVVVGLAKYVTDYTEYRRDLTLF